jgi:hypothetical protein
MTAGDGRSIDEPAQPPRRRRYWPGNCVEWLSQGVDSVRGIGHPTERIGDRYVAAGIDSELGGGCPSPGSYRMKYDYGEYGEWGFDVGLD